MSNITAEYFVTLFDEFKKVPEPKLDVYLDLASMRVPSSVWGSSTKYATALLAAHMLSTSGRQGGGPTGGAITAEAVGDLSRSYATCFVPGSGDAVLMTTRYGIDFIALRRETIVSGMTTRGAVPPRPCY